MLGASGSGEMPSTLSWSAVLGRLALSLVAGAIVGFNRSERGQSAGLRTTILVCLAASAAMIQVNLLLVMAHERQSLVSLDLMRLPLGILSGMGFIGGGVILHRRDLVRGVTTAATLWYVTVMGLCLGGGQYALGLELLAIGVFVLWALKRLELRFLRYRRGELVLTIEQNGPTDADIERDLAASGVTSTGLATSYDPEHERRTVRLELRWRMKEEHSPFGVPPSVAALTRTRGIARVRWSRE